MEISQKSPGYFDLLRDKYFSLFFFSQVLTNLGDGLFVVAVTFFSIKLGATPIQLGFITFCTVLPRGMLAPLGGIIADRQDKRMLITAVEFVRALLVITIPILYSLDMLSIWTIAVVGALVSGMFAIGAPAAKAFIPQLTDANSLQVANSLIQAVGWPAYFVGSGTLAVLSSAMSAEAIFYVAGMIFAFSFVLLTFTRPTKAAVSENKPTTDGIMADLHSGYAAIQASRDLYMRLITYPVYAFFWRGVLQIALPLFVVKQIDGGAGLFGILMLVNGFGELIGNLVMGKQNLKTPIVTAFLGESLLGIATLILAASYFLPFPSAFLVLSALLIGISAAIIDIPLINMIQVKIPEHHVAKVFGFWFFTGASGGALGTLLAGIYFENLPIVLGVSIAGLLIFVVGALEVNWARQYVARGK